MVWVGFRNHVIHLWERMPEFSGLNENIAQSFSWWFCIKRNFRRHLPTCITLKVDRGDVLSISWVKPIRSVLSLVATMLMLYSDGTCTSNFDPYVPPQTKWVGRPSSRTISNSLQTNKTHNSPEKVSQIHSNVTFISGARHVGVSCRYFFRPQSYKDKRIT